MLPQSVIDAARARVERIRAKNTWEDGILKMPFFCELCEQWRSDYAGSGGDGLPFCKRCIDACVTAIMGGGDV
jgi:hypothetical protein